MVTVLLPSTGPAVALFGFPHLRPAAGGAQGCPGADAGWDGGHSIPIGGSPSLTAPRPPCSALTQTGPGRTIQHLLPALPDLCARLMDADHSFDTTEISLGAGTDAHTYTVDLSTLRDFRGLVIGRLLMLHDLTEQRRAEARLVDQQRTLAVLQERERLARELHDSLGQVLAAAHLQANSARLLLGQGQLAQADECLGRLADTTLAAETDVRDYLLGLKSVTSADRPFFPTLREYLRHFTRQYGLPVNLVVPPSSKSRGCPTASRCNSCASSRKRSQTCASTPAPRRASHLHTGRGQRAGCHRGRRPGV